MARGRLHDVIRGGLRKLDVVPGVVLPELQPVSLRDIERWLYELTPDMFAPEQIEPFREEALSGLKELAAKGDPVPMTRIVAMMQSVAERISPADRS